MKLKEYRIKNNVKMSEIAKSVKKSVQHLYEIERGDAFPSRKLALAIEKETSGAVTSQELLFPLS